MQPLFLAVICGCNAGLLRAALHKFTSPGFDAGLARLRAIQALDRLDPVLLLSPGRAERHGFEYYRHGTLSLYAALNTQTGEVLAKTSARHTCAEFVDFPAKIVDSQPASRQIHVIADNLSAHKTRKVFEFL